MHVLPTQEELQHRPKISTLLSSLVQYDPVQPNPLSAKGKGRQKKKVGGYMVVILLMLTLFSLSSLLSLSPPLSSLLLSPFPPPPGQSRHYNGCVPANTTKYFGCDSVSPTELDRGCCWCGTSLPPSVPLLFHSKREGRLGGGGGVVKGQ